MLGIETPGIDRRIQRALVRARNVPSYPLEQLLDATERYLAVLDDIAAADPETLAPEDATSTRIELGYLARRLTSSHASGNAAARDALVRFIAAQPETMPNEEGFEFRLNASFPHAAVWQHFLAPLCDQPGQRFLEIGVADGRATCWLLTHVVTHGTSTITCADYFGSNEARFDNNVRRAGGGERVIKLQGDVRMTLRNEPASSFHAVYVDAASRAVDQLLDCLNAWTLLKPRGLMIIDDYGGPHDWEPGVRLGTDAFLIGVDNEIELLHRGFQVIARKQ